MTTCVKKVQGTDDTLVDKLIALGVISILDLEDVGPQPLVKELNIDPAVAEELVVMAGEQAKALAAESKRNQAEAILQTEQHKEQPEPAGDEQQEISKGT